MPDGLPNLGGDLGAEAEPEFVTVLAPLHAPGQAEKAFEVEAGGNGIGITGRLAALDPGNPEDTDLGVERRAAPHEPEAACQDEPIEAQLGRLLGSRSAVAVPDPELEPLGQGIEDGV